MRGIGVSYLIWTSRAGKGTGKLRLASLLLICKLVEACQVVLNLSLGSVLMLAVFGLFTVSVQVELWGASSHVGNGTDNGQTIRQLLLVLVMMVFQQRFPHLLSQLVSNGEVYLLVVQDHVWGRNSSDYIGPNDVHVNTASQRIYSSLNDLQDPYHHHLLSLQWCSPSCPAAQSRWRCSSAAQTGCATTAWPHTVCSIARLHPQHPPRTSATCNRGLSASQERPIGDKLVGHLLLLQHQHFVCANFLQRGKEMRRKWFPLQLQEWVSTTYCSGNAHFPHMDTFFISRSGIMGISAPLNQSA